MAADDRVGHADQPRPRLAEGGGQQVHRIASGDPGERRADLAGGDRLGAPAGDDHDRPGQLGQVLPGELMELRRAQDAHRHRRLLKDLLLAQLAPVVAVWHPVYPDDRERDDVPHARPRRRAHKRPCRCLEELAAGPLARRRGVGRVDDRVDARERDVKANRDDLLLTEVDETGPRSVTSRLSMPTRPARGTALGRESFTVHTVRERGHSAFLLFRLSRVSHDVAHRY
jgi:hypothetical protein